MAKTKRGRPRLVTVEHDGKKHRVAADRTVVMHNGAPHGVTEHGLVFPPGEPVEIRRIRGKSIKIVGKVKASPGRRRGGEIETGLQLAVAHWYHTHKAKLGAAAAMADTVKRFRISEKRVRELCTRFRPILNAIDKGEIPEGGIRLPRK